MCVQSALAFGINKNLELGKRGAHLGKTGSLAQCMCRAVAWDEASSGGLRCQVWDYVLQWLSLETYGGFGQGVTTALWESEGWNMSRSQGKEKPEGVAEQEATAEGTKGLVLE